jgi:hypothetical protein
MDGSRREGKEAIENRNWSDHLTLMARVAVTIGLVVPANLLFKRDKKGFSFLASIFLQLEKRRKNTQHSQ